MDNKFIKLHEFTFTVPEEDIVKDSVTISKLFTYGRDRYIFVNRKDITYFREDDVFPLTVLSLRGLHTIWVTEDVDMIFKILNGHYTYNLESGKYEK